MPNSDPDVQSVQRPTGKCVVSLCVVPDAKPNVSSGIQVDGAAMLVDGANLVLPITHGEIPIHGQRSIVRHDQRAVISARNPTVGDRHVT